MILKLKNKIGMALIAVCLMSTLCAFSKNGNSLYDRKKSLKLEVKSERLINVVNKPVVIYIFLKNLIDESIEITEPAIDEDSFMVEITMPDGKKDKLLDIYGLKLKTLRLYPNKRIKFKTEFIPEVAGNYDIKVIYNGYIEEKLIADPITVFVVNSGGG